MRVGILVPSIGAFGQKGFYNAQEIGLAKALDKLCNEVLVYRLVDKHNDARTERIEGCKNATYYLLPAKRLGSNGLPNMNLLDNRLDALIFLSDTQLVVPQVYKWARKHHVVLIPYIGVIESHSSNKIKRVIMDFLFMRNLGVYKKLWCAAKTPSVKAELERKGVSRVEVAPVGLDIGVLNADYRQTDKNIIKQKYGYLPEDKVLLFIGRMCEEKQPLRMVELFAQANSQNPDYKLLMVGTGEQRAAVAKLVEAQGLARYVQFIDRVPNKDIWELYSIADCFVNLNQQEIFGMAILEAMYYGCKVVAWNAPGPSFIIEDGVSGCLADSNEGILSAIQERSILPEVAQKRIVDHFTWEYTAGEILRIVSNI